jgi:hypothetical protein
MWIENLANEILQFVKKFLSTFIRTFFYPYKSLKNIETNQADDLIKPAAYYFIALIIFITFFTSRKAGNVAIGDAYFYSLSNQVIKSTADDLPGKFDLTAFLFALPIFICAYSFIWFITSIFKVKQYDRRAFLNYVYLWAGSAQLLYIIIAFLRSLTLENAHFFLGNSISRGSLNIFYIIVVNAFLTLSYVLVFMPCLYAVARYFRETSNWKFFLIPIIAVYAIDFSYYSNELLSGYINNNSRNPIVIKGEFDNNFVKFNEITDTVQALKKTSFSIILSNESDSTWAIPIGAKVNLYNYNEREIARTDSQTFEDFNSFISTLQSEARQPYAFKISRIENSTDSILILKPNDIKRVHCFAELSLRQYHELFELYGSTLKICEMDIFHATGHTNTWEQFWLKRKIIQNLTFDVAIGK